MSAGRYWSGVPKIRFWILMFGCFFSNAAITLGNTSRWPVYQLHMRTVVVPLDEAEDPEEQAASSSARATLATPAPP